MTTSLAPIRPSTITQQAEAAAPREPSIPPGTKVYRNDGIRFRRVISWRWHVANAERSLRGSRHEAYEQVLDAGQVAASDPSFSHAQKRAAARVIQQLADDVRRGRITDAEQLKAGFARALEALNARPVAAASAPVEAIDRSAALALTRPVSNVALRLAPPARG